MQSGQTCTDVSQRYKDFINQIKAWNPAAGSQCWDLWANIYVCVGVLEKQKEILARRETA